MFFWHFAQKRSSSMLTAFCAFSTSLVLLCNSNFLSVIPFSLYILSLFSFSFLWRFISISLFPSHNLFLRGHFTSGCRSCFSFFFSIHKDLAIRAYKSNSAVWFEIRFCYCCVVTIEFEIKWRFNWNQNFDYNWPLLD